MADTPRTPDEQPTVELPDLLRAAADLPTVAKDDGPVDIPRIVPASSGDTGRTRPVTPAARPADEQPTTQAIPATRPAPVVQPPTQAVSATPPPAPTQVVPVVPPATPAPAAPARPAPTPIPGRRRSLRVIRQIDTWSVFKVALLFHLFLYVVVLTAGALLWRVAQNTGTVDNVERFFENFGWTSFEFNGGAIYHEAWVAGLFAVVGATGLAVLMATVFNLITDLVGGVKVTVVEEEFPAPAGPRPPASPTGGRGWSVFRPKR